MTSSILTPPEYGADPAFGPSDPSHSAVSRPTGFNPGEIYRIDFPFVRDTYSGFDGVEGIADMPTWKPGTRHEWISPEDTAEVADALGSAIFTVEAVFKPGRFPTRVFYTRQFVNPDGKQFGKGNLRIATAPTFRRLIAGYRFPFGIGKPLENAGNWNRAKIEAEFRALLAEYAPKDHPNDHRQTRSIHND